MAFGIEAFVLADLVAEGDEFGDVDRFDLTRVDVDEDGVGLFAVGELVVRLIAVEGDLLDDAGFFEELEGSVDGGFGDSEAALADGFEEGVCFEQAVELDDGVEDVGAFGGVLLVFGFEFAPEDGAEGFFDVEVDGAVEVGAGLARGVELHGMRIGGLGVGWVGVLRLAARWMR